MKDRTILLVEDNPSDVDLTKRALKRNGIANELVVAKDGKVALEYLFDAKNSPPAVILLDLKLPGVDGLEVLQQLRTGERTRRLPVVILTSSREQEDLAQCYDNGANSYIRKPVDFNQFAETIRSLGHYWLILNEPPPQP